MIDPTNITNYNLTANELEEHILFWVAAAGKNGKTAAKCLDKFLKLIGYPDNKISPFVAIEHVVYNYYLSDLLKMSGIGCYRSKATTFVALATSSLNLRTCPVEELEKIYGIGKKTSRCFILHSREGAQYAGLDTHMLKHLRVMGVKDVPKQTPSSSKQYKRLENEVLKLAKAAKMTPTDYDLKIWNKYSTKSLTK